MIARVTTVAGAGAIPEVRRLHSWSAKADSSALPRWWPFSWQVSGIRWSPLED